MLDIRSEIEAAAASLPSEDSQSSTTETADSPSSETPATPATPEPTQTPTPDPAANDDEVTLATMGAIPVERVRKILDNARTKAAAEAEGKYAWAKDLTQQQVSEQKQILSWLDSDPVGFIRFLESQVKGNPAYASQLTPPAETAPPDPQPQPDVQLSDGSLTYSQGQFDRLFAWRERQLENRFAERFGPIERDYKEATARNQGMAKAQAVLSDAQTWPGFTESMEDIRVLMSQDKRVTLESAYRRVVVPKLQAQDKDRRDSLRKELLAELKQKPAANTQVPGRASNGTPESFKGKSTEDVMRSILAEMG